MGTTQPFRIMSEAGVKRDGTLFEGGEYKDALWCRFTRRRLPRKMAGYKGITSRLPELVRGMDAFFAAGVNYIHVGSQSFIQQQLSDMQGNPGSLNDRTPSGFSINPNNLWQMDNFYNTATGQTAIVAHAGLNLNDITNTVETPIYYGAASATAALVASGMPNVSGGIVALPPYFFGYSNYGRVDVSPVNSIASGITFNSAFISDQKIVKGLPLRNGGGGPAGIFWSLADLIIVTFNPSIVSGIPFSFNTVSSEISVLSSSSIVEYDGIYYWPEVDHFSMFNGVVREIPNAQNHDWFFSNLNFQQRQKVFAIKNQAWGEIWWCFPKGNSVECNWAMIYNVYLNCWYDTPLPDGGRTFGVSPRVFNKPYMCDPDLQTGQGYTLWQHETGLDKTLGGRAFPIRSYFKTAEISPLTANPPKDKAYRVNIVEPDFGNVGPVTVTAYARANAQDTQKAVGSDVINQPPQAGQEALAVLQTNARLLSFQVESNSVGGDYYLGQALAHIEESDGRMTT